MSQKPNFWSCEDNHSFDKAKQGYINLLLANKKNSSEPGDNAQMMSARRDFLNADYYRPLAELVSSLAYQYVYKNNLQSKDDLSNKDALQNKERNGGEHKHIVDLGCGEGYYLHQVYKHIQSHLANDDAKLQEGDKLDMLHVHGVDISKIAIKKATQLPFFAHWAVASNYSCPVLSHSVDLALCIFAPIRHDEVRRILSKKGVFLRVLPGPRHFYQLKSALYSQVNLHKKPDVDSNFSLLDEHHIHFTIKVTNEGDVKNLLTMTPLNWHGSEDAKMALIQEGIQGLECDFIVQVLKPLYL